MDLTPYAPLLISAGFGYLLGSIPFGLLLGRMNGVDLRQIGSGNIGATNMLRTGKRGLAALTLLLDSGKAAAALLAARYVFDGDAGLFAGGAAFFGHCFPIWLRFKGGKGVATFFGVMLAGATPVGAACAFVWLIIAFAFHYSSLAALLAAASAPFFAHAFHQGDHVTIFALVLALVIAWRHAPNIAALAKGKERKIDLGRKRAV